ncbi:MAG: hypothetical protein JWQ21_2097 [Herminiimonas sp.]|nr:hypothetical protein [Herminiimonas sp.]
MIAHTESESQKDQAVGEEEGVSFNLTVRGSPRRCFITRDALLQISRIDKPAVDLLSIFHQYEFRIYRLARTLAAMGIKGTPLVLGPWTFRIDALTCKGKSDRW